MAVDSEVGAVHSAEIASAAFFGIDHVRRMVPLELKAEERANTLVGQNSTQNPQALQRSTTMETRPFAT
jgi:hypothetical protein